MVNGEVPTEYLARPGVDKGCLASGINFHEINAAYRRNNSALQPPHVQDDEYEQIAMRDYNRVVRALRHINLRKSVPSWCIPVEIFAMLMLPDRRKASPERCGAGRLVTQPIGHNLKRGARECNRFGTKP